MNVGKFLNGLTIIFVIARLFNLISWSWWLVFIPTYVYVVLLIFMFIVAVILAAIESVL